MVNGKAKGSEFERQVCRQLSLWLTKGNNEDLFWRSASSGGRATFQLKQGIVNKNQAGDISPISMEGALFLNDCVIECKFYNDLQIMSSIIKGRGRLKKFWVQISKIARTIDKHPILIAKQNHFPILLIVSNKFLVFGKEVIIKIPTWKANVYLFDDVVKPDIVRKPKIKRLAI